MDVNNINLIAYIQAGSENVIIKYTGNLDVIW
jgi:hypothetical protein